MQYHAPQMLQQLFFQQDRTGWSREMVSITTVNVKVKRHAAKLRRMEHSTIASTASIRLENADKEAIIHELRNAFADFFDFETLAIPPLENLLNNIPSSLIISTTSILKDNKVDKKRFQNKEAKKDQDLLRTILACCHVLLYRKTEEAQRYFWDLKQFFNHYPEYFHLWKSAINDDGNGNCHDVLYLLNYRNFLVLALKLLPPDRTKGLAIQIAYRLEGSKEIYVLGSGQRDGATRREDIYYKESGQRRPNEVTPIDRTKKHALVTPISSSAKVPRLHHDQQHPFHHAHGSAHNGQRVSQIMHPSSLMISATDHHALQFHQMHSVASVGTGVLGIGSADTVTQQFSSKSTNSLSRSHSLGESASRDYELDLPLNTGIRVPGTTQQSQDGLDDVFLKEKLEVDTEELIQSESGDPSGGFTELARTVTY